MRIALLSLEAPLDRQAPCTGNQVRADHLKRGLAHHGYEVTQLWRAESQAPDTFSSPAGLADQLAQKSPDIVLAGYWELVEWLPQPLDIPVIVDCVAPRPLEFHYEQPRQTREYIERFIRVLGLADRVLCGNRRQRRLMLGWLLQAGTDLRRETPVMELPLSCDPENIDLDRTTPDRWLLVSGGRHWPWRQSERWLAALGEEAGRLPASVLCMVPPDSPLPPGVTRSPLMTYDGWRDFLRTQAHVGLELADFNVEREFSQSFRAMACLEAGLPLMLNDYLELGAHIERFRAGWRVSTPDQAADTLRTLIESPRHWREASTGARKLSAAFDFRTTVKPLAEWLENPVGPSRFKTVSAAPAATPKPARGRWKLLPRMLIGGLMQPFRKSARGRGVVVTRADLFPTDHGAAVKIVETARALAGRGRPVAIVTADRNRYWSFNDGEIEQRRLPAWLRWLAPSNALVHSLYLLRGWPASNAFLYWALWDPFYALRAVWVGRKLGASIYLAEFPGYARACLWAKYLNGGQAVMVEHNVEYLRIRQQDPELTDRQFEKLKRWELSLARACDAVVCVSQEDHRRLVADGADARHLLVIPHGVDASAPANAEPANIRDDFELDPELPVLVYHGTYSYPPNAEAMRVMADEILPRLDRAGYPVQVLAIGSAPVPGLAHERIHFPGSLEQLGPALRAAQLAAVPLIEGGGTRMKILDYFAAGVPVVSTAKGCEGIPVSDGVELLIRDDWDGFAAAIIELLEDDARREAIRRSAEKFVERLDWSAIGKRYDELFRLLSGRIQNR